MKNISILVCGVNGAMGKSVVDCASNTDHVTVVAGYDKVSNDNYPFSVYTDLSEIKENIQGVIDFSHSNVAKSIAEYCVENKLPLVSATTGIDNETEEYYHEISNLIPVFRSKNFSYGISVMKKLIEQATKLLFEDYDIELIDAHHNKKADAPSGTAQMLLESIENSSDKQYEMLYGRHGNDSKRNKNEITVHALRGGTIVGDHTVMYAGEDEIISISHKALSKKVFAVGALKAMQFIVQRENGYYSMDDITNNE